MKKLTVHSEVTYLFSIILLAFAVAMLSAADFGVSMIVAPAYIFAQAIGITFGQAEYVIQAVLFIVFCIVVKKFKWIYLSSFLTCLIYGAVLDLWRLIPFFNPGITPPGSMELWVRIVMFVVGLVLTSFSIALCFKAYFYPQVYDFFVKGVSEKYKLKRPVFKTFFDLCFLAIGTVMTLAIFGKFVGVWFGTLIIALVNGTLIGVFGKLLDKFTDSPPIFAKISRYFEFFE